MENDFSWSFDVFLMEYFFISAFDQMDKTRFVFKFVQAARARKSKKKITSTISSVTSDTMSMDSSSTVSLLYELNDVR